jgi:hypothetical protein
MLSAICHCHAVRFEIDQAPAWVLDCNCSVCRRYGALWAYYRKGGLRLLSDPDATFAYLWGDKSLAFHHCKTCGCTTHLQAADVPGRPAFGINARLILGVDREMPVRQIDNAHTGVFWTKSSAPPLPGRHPKLEDHDDWFAPYK